MKFTVSDTDNRLLAEFNYPLFKTCSLVKLDEIAHASELIVNDVELLEDKNVIVHFIMDDRRDDLCKSIATIIGEVQVALYDYVLLEEESLYTEL